MSKGEAHMLTMGQFEHYWPAIVPQLEAVREMWDIWWTREALYDAVVGGLINAWAIGSPTAIHLVAFTQIINYPANRNLKVVLIVGNSLEEYYDVAEATIEKFAMDNGCVYIEASGRLGWQRKLKNVKCHGVVLTRKLGTIRVQ